MAGGRAEIAGSAVTRSATVRRVRPADPDQTVEASIVIRRPFLSQSAGENTSALSSPKTREEIEKSLAAEPSDITAVTDLARRYGLKVIESSAARRTVRVEGSAQNMNRAFGIELAYFEGPNGTFLSYDGPLTVDFDVAPSIMAVLGLHQEPVAKSRTGLAE
jgi:kumamolisin